MIQRIQSIYLLLMVVCFILMFVFSLASYDEADTHVGLFLTHFDGAGDDAEPMRHWPSLILTILLSAISLLSLFSFRQRKKQMGLGRLMYLLIIGLIVANYFYISANTPVDGSPIYGASFYLPVAALAFNFLANHAIRQDEELVKSIDRLR